MKKLLFFAICALCFVDINAQQMYSGGVYYSNGKPERDLSLTRSKLVIDTLNEVAWLHKSDTTYHNLFKISHGVGYPSGDPGDEPKTYINTSTGEISRWNGSSWELLGSGTSENIYTDDGTISGEKRTVSTGGGTTQLVFNEGIEDTNYNPNAISIKGTGANGGNWKLSFDGDKNGLKYKADKYSGLWNSFMNVNVDTISFGADFLGQGNFFLMTGASMEFWRLNTATYGLQYRGFGETSQDDWNQLADYSRLKNNSLVPKSYSDPFDASGTPIGNFSSRYNGDIYVDRYLKIAYINAYFNDNINWYQIGNQASIDSIRDTIPVLLDSIAVHRTEIDDLKSTPIFAHLTVSTAQNMGGANGTVHYVDWDGTPEHLDSGFTYSPFVFPSRIQVDNAGRYSLYWVVGIQQGGTARTTYMSSYRINGSTTVVRGRQRNYSRGSGYGDTSTGMTTELELNAGDYIEVSITIDDADGAYTSNCIPAECELIIRKID